MRDKQALTKTLVDQIDPAVGIAVADAVKTWWVNPRNRGGMRLTGIGYRTFTEDLDLEHYAYPIDDLLLFNQRTILKLDRKMQMPYYIDVVKKIPKRIVFFGSKEAVMVNLYGNLQQFLDKYEP